MPQLQTPAPTDAELARLCAEVGRALHASGAPAHRVEQGVDETRAAFQREGATVATPTALWIQVGDHAHIVRLPAGDIHLARMVAVLRHVQRLGERPVTVRGALRALRKLTTMPSPWPRPVEHVAFVLTSALAAVLLGGTAVDVLLSGIGGGLALLFLGRVHALSAWTPLRDALLATVLGALGALGAAIGATPSVVALASAILVVPGLSLTTALAELGAGHWTAGGSRLLGSLLVLAQLAAGLAVGWWLVGEVPLLVAPVAIPEALVRLTPLLAPAGFAVLLRTRASDLPVVWLTAILGWSVATALPGIAGAAAGGLTVALAAGTLGRLVRVPDLALIVPGILLLVPGTVGVHGVEQLLSRDLLDGAGTALAALETAGSIAAGVFAGQAFVRSAERMLLAGPREDDDERPSTDEVLLGSS
jgi:uncharacterized membrane protein YjjP (DUF1212 family)